VSINPRYVAAGAGLIAAMAAPLVMRSEGEVPKTYLDPAGIATACYGHTGKDVAPGQTYTHEQCLQILQRDLAKHDADVVRCVPNPMPVHVHVAALDFAFNVGAQKFCASGFAAKLRAGDWAGACAEIGRWTRIGARDCRDPANKCGGIVKRRDLERAVCEGRQPLPEIAALGVTG
jgi:lysozyme